MLDPAARDRYEDWDEVAEIIAANLRLATARHPDDRQLNELVGEFLVKVPEFRTWWNSRRVTQCAFGRQRFRHPIVGGIALHYEVLTFLGDPDQALCVYTAEAGSPAADSLALLASWSGPAVDSPRAHESR